MTIRDLGPAGERDTLIKLRRVLKPVQGTLSMPMLVALLTVATEPGISVNELAERTGTPQQTASRHVSILAGRYDGVSLGEEFEALIAQEIHPNDPRKRALFLTEAGRKLVKSLATAARQHGGSDTE